LVLAVHPNVPPNPLILVQDSDSVRHCSEGNTASLKDKISWDAERVTGVQWVVGVTGTDLGFGLIHRE
jgi:hypothetical protein